MNKYDNLIQKAKIAYQEERLEDAVRYYEEAFLEKVFLGDLLHLGVIYLDLKNYHRATKIFNDIIEIEPDNFYAYYGLASCYSELRIDEKAIDYFKKVIENKEDFYDAYFGIALLLDMQDNSQSEYYYLKTIEYCPDHYWANTNLGSHYEKENKLDLALKHSLVAYNKNPEGNMISYNLGVIYSKLDDYDNALKYYLEEANKEEHNSNVYLNLGLIYKDIHKDYKTALKYYLEGISKDQNNYDIWYNLGCLYAIMDDYDNAYNCLLYANLKEFDIREYMYQDHELIEFRKSKKYEQLMQTITGCH